MITFINTLIPIMTLICIGFILKRTNFLPEGSWQGIEKLTYFILFPALLIRTLGQQTIDGMPWASMLLVIFGTLTIAAIVLIMLRKKITKNKATFTSVFQGGVRFNTYIAFAIAQSLYGTTGIAMSSVAAGFMIVLINLYCISIFLMYGHSAITSTIQFIKSIMFNPLIIACSIGWFLSLSGLGVPKISADILEIIGQAALPFGLLAVGAALKPQFIQGHFKAIAFSSVIQFALKPFIAITLINYIELDGIAATVLIIAFITPTAPSSYILARQLGGDIESMASIITVQTLLAFMTMPLLGMILL